MSAIFSATLCVIERQIFLTWDHHNYELTIFYISYEHV